MHMHTDTVVSLVTIPSHEVPLIRSYSTVTSYYRCMCLQYCIGACTQSLGGPVNSFLCVRSPEMSHMAIYPSQLANYLIVLCRQAARISTFPGGGPLGL